jgi:general secretion pathway protein C
MMKRISVPTSLAALRPDTTAAVRWTTVLLVAALAVSLAQLTWLLLPVPPMPPAPSAISAAQLTTGGAAAPRLEAVATLHLFGTAATTAQPVAAQVDAPETSLNLTLRGLFATTRKEAAFAIIAEGSGNERHFRIGDKITGGTVVHDILPDRVVLERAGRFETLRLPKERLDMAVPVNAKGGRSERMPDISGQLRDLRTSLKSNPQEILNIAEMQPVMVGGQLRGYRIRPRRHQELFRATGLTPNDVVTAINGIPVTDPTQFANLTAQLVGATTLRLSVERPDGRPDEISINMN